MGKRIHIIVRVVVAEGDAGGMKQVLPIDKDDRALDCGLDRIQREAKRQK
jgi:hypothetical protein